MNRHAKIHKKSSHHCYLCEKTFPLKYYLTQHLKKAHKIVNYNVQMAKFLKEADSGEYKCQLCKKVFCGEEADRKLADHLVSKCNKSDRSRIVLFVKVVALFQNTKVTSVDM